MCGCCDASFRSTEREKRRRRDDRMLINLTSKKANGKSALGIVHGPPAVLAGIRIVSPPTSRYFSASSRSSLSSLSSQPNTAHLATADPLFLV
jgi:hypothetical protein